MGRAYSMNGGGEQECIEEKPEGKRPLGKPACRWVDDIKINLRETGWGGVYWIDLAQDSEQWRALVNTVMNL
jgi:hypothetical protein